MTHHNRNFLAGFLVLTLMILSACGQASQTVNPPTATPLPPTATARPSGKVDVGGYQLSYRCYGQGEPTVIVEAGLGDAPAATFSWILVTNAIQRITRICVYDRAGIGDSDKAPTPRTSQDAARDLHTLLHQIPLPGPYILVGASIGGFHVREFTHLYPEDAAGVILVDSVHPDQFDQFVTAYPTAFPNEPAAIATNRPDFVNTPQPSDNPEGLDIMASVEQVRNAGSLGDIPLIVISQAPNPDHWLVDGFTKEDSQRYVQIWQTLQADLATLSSNSTHLTAQKSGLALADEEPKIVVDAITQMVKAIQGR